MWRNPPDDGEEVRMINSKEGAANYWRAQTSDSLTWIGNSTRLLAAALAIRDLAESLCPGVFDEYELADDNPTQKETILGLIAAYQMQSSLAVENALKGLLIAVDTRQQRPILESNGKLSKRYRTHDGAEIAELCSVELSPVLKDFLLHCTRTVKWGKYGLGLSVDEHWFESCEPYDDNALLLQFLEDIRGWHDAVAAGSMEPDGPKKPRPHVRATTTFDAMCDEFDRLAGPGFAFTVNGGVELPPGYCTQAIAVKKSTGEVKEILLGYKRRARVTVLTGDEAAKWLD